MCVEIKMPATPSIPNGGQRVPPRDQPGPWLDGKLLLVACLISRSSRRSEPHIFHVSPYNGLSLPNHVRKAKGGLSVRKGASSATTQSSVLTGTDPDVRRDDLPDLPLGKLSHHVQSLELFGTLPGPFEKALIPTTRIEDPGRLTEDICAKGGLDCHAGRGQYWRVG